MKIRQVIRVIVFWVVIWIGLAALFSIAVLSGALGPSSFPGRVAILATLAALTFGFVGGVIFAPFFSWFAPYLSSKLAKACLGALLGAVAGAVAFTFCASSFLDPPLAIGPVAGGVTGFVCILLSRSSSRDQSRTA